MRLRSLCALTLLAFLTGTLAAQEARVRAATKVSMPTQVDSNSPAFWRNGRLNWFGSHGRPLLSQGPDQFGPWETREVSVVTANQWPHWLESVWTGEDSAVWGWYHCEPVGLFEGSTLTAPKIGAVVSFDGGNTLQDLGIILESGDPLNPDAQNGYFAGGHGDFSVILNRERTHFYFFFDNYGGAVDGQGVVMARMAYEDRFNPAGKVWKYQNGRWHEPGVTGRATPIFPVRRGWETRDPDAFWGPSVHWNTHLNCYVMLLNHAAGEPGWSQEGVYISYSTDLSRPGSWSEPVRILDKSQFPGWYFFYPQVMGLEPGGTDTLAGQTARLYVGGISKWEIDFFPKAAPPVAPELRLLPASGSVTVGEAATLTVTPNGTPPFTYQWWKDGIEIAGATTARLSLVSTVEADSGVYSVLVTNEFGSSTSNRVTLTVLPVPVAPPVLANLSVRSHLTSSRAVQTVGFVLQSVASKPVLIRAMGPSLAQFGIEGGVADPRLEVFDRTTATIGASDRWSPGLLDGWPVQGSTAPPAGNADAGLMIDLPGGATTAQVRGSSPGLVFVEVFDPSPTPGSRIINMSARAMVGTGENVLIGGFAIAGSGTTQLRLLIRAIGPQLASFGVGDALADPVIEIFNSRNLKIAENDDWDPSLESTFAAAGAYALATGSRDAALVVTLAAGQGYTVIVRSGTSAIEGEAMLEIFELP